MKIVDEPPKPIRALLRIATFRRFAAASLISATGSAMAPLALAYAVIEQGGGAGSLGVVLATNTVPTIVFLLAGGLFADRLSRSLLLFVGNLLAAAAQGALAVTVATGHATTVSIAACGFVSGTAASFVVPAAQGAVAQIVPAQHLQQANALLRLPGNAVKVLGPVVGGALVAAGGAAWALAWDAVTFAVAAVLLLGLRLDAPLVAPGGVLSDLRGSRTTVRSTNEYGWNHEPCHGSSRLATTSCGSHRPTAVNTASTPLPVVGRTGTVGRAVGSSPPTSSSLTQTSTPSSCTGNGSQPAVGEPSRARPCQWHTSVPHLRAGWAGFWSRTWLWTYTAVGTVLVAAWLAGFQLLGPLVAAEQYAGARDWGLIQAAFTCGLLVGTLVCLRWKPYRLLTVAVVAAGALALPLAAMACTVPLPLVLSATALAGVGLDVAIVAWATAFQQRVPQAEQGRMSAFNGVGERLAIPMGYLIAALAARSWSSQAVLLACAGMIAAATVLNLCVPDVYRINRLTEQA
ncbi:MFS transporter [Streptomyces rochei]|uniref:MFS transporter n=1 Tax=Streptomyces rochei TaxID=1928 RepID=UPI003D8E48AD